MKQTSTALPASQTESRVTHYLNRQLEAMKPEKSLAKIADEAGFPQRNLLSMIRSGQTKLPFDRLIGLAKALHVDPGHLFRMALAEYLPHVKALLDAFGDHAISKNEQRLLEAWREASGDEDPPVELIVDGLRALAGRAMEANGAQRGQ